MARMFVLVLMLIAKHPLSWVSEEIAWPFRHDPKLFLVLVMIGCPLCMNALQLWIQDAFLKWKEWSAIPIGSAGAFSKIGSDRAYVTRTSRGS